MGSRPQTQVFSTWAPRTDRSVRKSAGSACRVSIPFPSLEWIPPSAGTANRSACPPRGGGRRRYRRTRRGIAPHTPVSEWKTNKRRGAVCSCVDRGNAKHTHTNSRTRTRTGQTKAKPSSRGEKAHKSSHSKHQRL